MLELAGDKAVIGIDRVVLAAGSGSLEACLLDREIELAALLPHLRTPSFHGADRGFDAKRLQPLDDFGADCAVDPHPAERDAPIGAMVQMATAAVITARTAILAAVSDMELAAAVSAAEQAGEQCLATSNRPAAHKALAVGVVADQPLVPLELGPARARSR